MAHGEQMDFCKSVKQRFPEHFKNKKVLDVGSQDINGNNIYIFEDSEVLGIDLGPVNNVNLVCHGADLDHENETYDTVISTEAFEHDARFKESLENIVRLLKPNGMFLFTCAAPGRPEHGTHGAVSWASPHTLDFYQNRSEEDVRALIDIDGVFPQHEFSLNPIGSMDLYFWGIKK